MLKTEAVEKRMVVKMTRLSCDKVGCSRTHELEGETRDIPDSWWKAEEKAYQDSDGFKGHHPRYLCPFCAKAIFGLE